MADGPRTLTAAGATPADTPMLPAMPLLVPPDFPDTAVSSAMCLWAEDVDNSVDIARQASMCMPTLRQSSASIPQCTCLSKPLQKLVVTAVRAVTGEASFQLSRGSDAQSDSSEADSLSMPTTSATTTIAAPSRSGRQHKSAAEY